MISEIHTRETTVSYVTQEPKTGLLEHKSLAIFMWDSTLLGKKYINVKHTVKTKKKEVGLVFKGEFWYTGLLLTAIQRQFYNLNFFHGIYFGITPRCSTSYQKSGEAVHPGVAPQKIQWKKYWVCH